MSPASTSTQSPVCSPSTPMIVAPLALRLSRTWLASALAWRADSAVAMTSESYRLVSWRTSSTTMSRALMSSRAVTAMFWILLRRILSGPIQLVAVNISQNRRRKQTGDLRPRVGSAGERIPDRSRRYRLGRHLLPIYRTRQLTGQARPVGGQTPLPLHLERRRQRFDIERCARPLDDDEVSKREQ